MCGGGVRGGGGKGNMVVRDRMRRREGRRKE